jgi:hypothetical protein
MAITKETAVSNIVTNVKILRDITDTASDAKISVYASRYYDSACAVTGYDVLPDSLLSFVEDAVVQAWMKRGAEGLNSQSAAGVSEQYIDPEYALRQNLRFKHNPLATVVIGGDEDA